MGRPRSASKNLFAHPARKAIDFLPSVQNDFNYIAPSSRLVRQIVSLFPLRSLVPASGMGSLRAASRRNKDANKYQPLGSPAPYVWVFSVLLSPENTVETPCIRRNFASKTATIQHNDIFSRLNWSRRGNACDRCTLTIIQKQAESEIGPFERL
jgi:hypothetical protein